MGDIGLVAMVDAAADAVVIVVRCSPPGRHQLGSDGQCCCSCSSDRRAGALLVGDIGLVAMVDAAADAVVIVVLVLS